MNMLPAVTDCMLKRAMQDGGEACVARGGPGQWTVEAGSLGVWELDAARAVASAITAEPCMLSLSRLWGVWGVIHIDRQVTVGR